MGSGVFLDRDGVLNSVVVVDGTPHPPTSAEQTQLLPGVERACRALKDAGLLLLVVTNQPDIARGRTTLAEVELINDKLRSLLPLDEVIVCPHDDDDHCPCRKPRPGMLIEAASRWHIDLPASIMVGDRRRDIDAGRAAGVSTVFVDHGYPETTKKVLADLSVGSLGEAVPFIISHTTRSSSQCLD